MSNNTNIANIEVQTLSDFTIEELQGMLSISGVLLAPGVWNGVHYTKPEIKTMYDNFKDYLAKLPYKVEHERLEEFKSTTVGNNTAVEWSDTLGAILYKAKITNSKVMDLIKSGAMRGTSMKIRLNKIMDNGELKGINYEPIDNSITAAPACDPSRIIISSEELNDEGKNITHSFSLSKENDINMTEIKIINEEELGVGEVKRKRITFEYYPSQVTSNPAIIQPATMPEPMEPAIAQDIIPEKINITDKFNYHKHNNKFIMARYFNTEDEAKNFLSNIDKSKELPVTNSIEENAVWSNTSDFPDSSFAYISPGGSKDKDGKTTPRSLRHLPYKDANGKVDAAHVRNALARLDQTNIPDAAKTSAHRKLVVAAKGVGVEANSLLDLEVLSMMHPKVVKNQDGKFDVVDDEGDVMRTFDTEAEAQKFITNMIANNEGMMSKDIVENQDQENQGDYGPPTFKVIKDADGNFSVIKEDIEAKFVNEQDANTFANAMTALENIEDNMLSSTQELVWEKTAQYIRSGHGVDSAFDKTSYRTMVIDPKTGIKAIIGCPIGHYKGGACDTGTKVKSFLFPIGKFSMDEAKKWFSSHNKNSKLSLEGNKMNENIEEYIIKPEELSAYGDFMTKCMKDGTSMKECYVMYKKQSKSTTKNSEIVENSAVVAEAPKKEEPKTEVPVIVPVAPAEQPKDIPKEIAKDVTVTEVKKEEVKVIESPKIVAPIETPKIEPIKEIPIAVAPVSPPITPVVIEPKKEEPKPIEIPVPVQRSNDDIVKDIVKDQNILADLLIKNRPRYGKYKD